MPRQKPDGKPIQLYIPENAFKLLDSVVRQRKAAGATSVSVSLIVREALAEKFGQSVEFFSVGEWGVRKDSGKGQGDG